MSLLHRIDVINSNAHRAAKRTRIQDGVELGVLRFRAVVASLEAYTDCFSLTPPEYTSNIPPAGDTKRRARVKPPTIFLFFWCCSLFFSSLHSAVDSNCFISL